MAYDQTTRNRLQRFVNEARNLLSEEFTRQFQQKYGLDASSGEVSELARLVHLDDRELETARMLRGTLDHYLASSPSGGKRECLERMIREQAFTVLNRLSALRMAEARDIIIESLSRTYNSKGFQLYARLAGTALGDTGDAYRTYIFSVFDELALDLPVLFDRFSSQGGLFPGEGILLEFLTLMNESDLIPLWAEDETIGWIYQYFNPIDERRQMRSESPKAPRNSRELAVRNQFFTPRYVVEFLTDNTLGRSWYEMTQGGTQLKDNCHYMVRRPQEIFLAGGEDAPVLKEPTEDLSQEELLQLPVYIPYRHLKDPREILMLDPACGSMHFGLYAFDLYEKIYEEAWDLESLLGSQAFVRSENLPALQKSYASKEEFLRDIPRLIVECNIHGVDIDSRAVQIAGLSLWLRAQRSWKYQGVKPLQRPQIRKSNIVCAEPMPGEKSMLEEFTRKLKPRVLGQLLEIIFEKMQLAGEIGSLLKIEVEIEEALNLAREDFRKEIQLRNEERDTLFPDMLSPRQVSIFDFTDLGDQTQFWNFSEQKLLDALKEYAEQAVETEAVQKRLFALDAARGFAFIDLFRKRYDVVLMNPPFGYISGDSEKYCEANYPYWNRNLLCAFFDRTLEIAQRVGSVFDRTAAIKTTYEEFRRNIFFEKGSLISQVDLGWGVLDADVEVSAAVLLSSNVSSLEVFFDLTSTEIDQKAVKFKEACEAVTSGKSSTNIFTAKPQSFKKLPNAVVGFQFPKFVLRLFREGTAIDQLGCRSFKGHDFKSDQHFRLYWEIHDISEIGFNNKGWTWVFNGGAYSRYYHPTRDIAPYGKDAIRIKGHPNVLLRNLSSQGKPGLGYGKRGQFLDSQIVAEGHAYTREGVGAITENVNEAFFFTAILNSPIFQFIINLYCGQHKGATYVNLFPCPIVDIKTRISIGQCVNRIWILKQKWQTGDESDIVFISPRIFSLDRDSLNNCVDKMIQTEANFNKEITVLTESVNDMINEIYKLETNEIRMIDEYTKSCQKDQVWIDAPSSIIERKFEHIASVISASFGFVFGRWDIRFATGEKVSHALPDPFEPIPVCPPGMLQNHNGLPVSSQDVPDDYPLRIIWSGIMVDDEGQPEDIVARVRETIKIIWKEKAEDIEQETCELLGVDTLRDYFRKPSNFFAEHLKRYTKSRRQAPIYWPLTTASGIYTIWLYYQRLSDQTLYKCVNDYVEPKLRQLTESTRQLRQKTVRSPQDEKELEEMLNLEQELQEFRDELLRVAAFWKPNLDDGVMITAAPLWKLFRLPRWRTLLEETWGEMENGECDWAHLAYNIWTDRVRAKCKNDQSLAIAHDLKDIYEEPVAQAKKKGSRGKKNT